MAEVPKEDAKPTLHHLNNSQSHRVLWLLEELKIPYNLTLHERLPTYVGPPSLKALSTEGKAPILITSSGATLTESIPIIHYLLKTYDPARKFRLAAADEDSVAPNWVQEEIAISLGQSTIGTAMLFELMHTVAEQRSPVEIRTPVKLFTGQFKTGFVEPGLHKAFTVLEEMLANQSWFSGREEPGRADFALSWSADVLSQRQMVDFGREFPRIHQWMDRYRGRDAYKSALEKGNGYDLRFQ